METKQETSASIARDTLVESRLNGETPENRQTYEAVRKGILDMPPSVITPELLDRVGKAFAKAIAAPENFCLLEPLREMIRDLNVVIGAYIGLRALCEKGKKREVELVNEMIKMTFMQERNTPAWGMPPKSFVPVRVGFHNG